MSDLDQAAIDSLTVCRKVIMSGPKKDYASVHGSRRNGFDAESDDGTRFRVFMRQHETFLEDFSVGLEVQRPDGSWLMLMRCNGPHGEVCDPHNQDRHHSYHIHRALVSNIEQGYKPERGGEPTTKYASFEQALRFFLQETGVAYTDDHFPGLRNRTLFDT